MATGRRWSTTKPDPRWSDNPFVDLKLLTPEQRRRVRAARRAWAALHATGDRSGLVELGILPPEKLE